MIKLRSTLATLAAMALTASLAVGAVAAEEASAEEPVGAFSIEGITWLLKAQAVDGELVEVPDRVTVSLFMEDGRAGGSGGCNSYFTDYVMDGFEVSFGPVGATMMACLPAVMDVEQAYFGNLGEVASYKSGGIQMALLNADGDPILEFEAAPPASVVGSWVATGINNQQEQAGVVSSDITSQVTAEFSPDGDLTGFDGCNNYFTTYAVDGDAIAISEMIGTTMMACESEELAEQSAWYFGALTKATTWAVDASGNLELRDADGSLQVKYAPAG
jgi:heat shock protein HslJ